MSDPRYARAFDSVAEQYERARPEYAEAAVDWLVEEHGLRPGDPVLDLAAGTGKLTRQLARHDLSVVAVEPGDEMRAVLKRVLPGVAALAGTAEKIPLPESSVEAVTVGQAFHWFEPEAALTEMKRVLRPECGIALLWNRWDEEDPLLSQVDALLNEIRPPVTRRDDFEFEHERRTFRQRRPMTVDAIVEWASSTSGWVNAPAEKQREIEVEIRRLGAGHGGEVSIATDAIVGWPENDDPHEYSATLSVNTKSVRLAELTARLGEPTRGKDIGEPVTLRRPDAPLRKATHWGLTSTAERSEPLDVHVAEILDFAESHRGELDALRAQCDICIWCGVFSGEDAQGGFTFDPALNRRLADLALEVVFDLY